MTFSRIQKENYAGIIIIFFIINFSFFSGNFIANAVLWTLLVIFVMLLGVQYKLHVHEDELVHEIFFLSFRIFNKPISPADIHRIKYSRTGWAKKKAVIKLKKGKNITVFEYKPAAIYEELERFARNHSIQEKKSKDYTILEKYY